MYWSGISATTNVSWTLQGVAISSGGDIDVLYGAAIAVVDATTADVEIAHVSAESSAVTIAGTPAEGDICYFRIGRDIDGGGTAGNDNMAGDARLHGIKLFFNTDTKNDA